MKRLWVMIVLALCATGVWAEKVADLPVPTSYVNDFAHVLTPGGAQQIEDLARAVHNQAQADLFVVTIKTLDDGESVEDFTASLEEKWKVGKKGVDRSAIYLLVLNPHKLRIETGYGLEGILNDAKVGAILDTATPAAAAGDYDRAMLVGMQGLTDVIAADAHVTIAPVVHTYHRQAAAPQKIGVGQVVIGILVVIVLFFLIKTGNLGWAFLLLQMFMGGGGGGGGGRDDDEGGGFGGVGGGESGGGGASRDF